ncbi:hypothetical protein HanXRQr2_Chr07g0313921 [Helianthus annuus]|uniref:Uncharacterized protein n=1 Tax=Helianthus annuus TaxID=4232 RepID=A0A9K3IP96_HELAN|nr:hypothetical protein HanXRQr2_Chr07g0313921 [Helianthus annuus]
MHTSGLKHGELTSQDEARKQIRIRTLKVSDSDSLISIYIEFSCL